MSNDWKKEFKFHWSLATCTLEQDERVIANEKLEAILHSDMFNEKQTKKPVIESVEGDLQTTS